jgi:hypothetical protein
MKWRASPPANGLAYGYFDPLARVYNNEKVC